MAGLLTGMDRDEHPLPMTHMSKAKSAPIMAGLYRVAFTANQILKAI
ncbi:MAG: hypothetical protein ABJO27_17200 [Pseudoruegeria sp.]